MTMRQILAALALAASACAQSTSMYHWGGYDEQLYRHYKNPQERAAFVEALRANILEAEQRGLRVPPGMYAEYGFALYEEGRFPDAVAYYRKEQDLWPESRPFMDKMIRNAERRAGTAPASVPASATGPAGALEGKR
ncbi:MAG TPA: DUF4810 domain-containing protein [Anaeromyxobacter sp.]